MKTFHASYVERRRGAAFSVNPARRKATPRTSICGDPTTDHDMTPKDFTKGWAPPGWTHCYKCDALVHASNAVAVSENS